MHYIEIAGMSVKSEDLRTAFCFKTSLTFEIYETLDYLRFVAGRNLITVLNLSGGVVYEE